MYIYIPEPAFKDREWKNLKKKNLGYTQTNTHTHARLHHTWQREELVSGLHAVWPRAIII